MTWNDRRKELTLEPGAPSGATNLVTQRTFNVELIPEGTTRSVRYTGRRVQARF